MSSCVLRLPEIRNRISQLLSLTHCKGGLLELEIWSDSGPTQIDHSSVKRKVVVMDASFTYNHIACYIKNNRGTG